MKNAGRSPPAPWGVLCSLQTRATGECGSWAFEEGQPSFYHVQILHYTVLHSCLGDDSYLASKWRRRTSKGSLLWDRDTRNSSMPLITYTHSPSGNFWLRPQIDEATRPKPAVHDVDSLSAQLQACHADLR
ncbi:hypothetical protein MHYP_G00046050 [Metynnis hypsauchen]